MQCTYLFPMRCLENRQPRKKIDWTGDLLDVSFEFTKFQILHRKLSIKTCHIAQRLITTAKSVQSSIALRQRDAPLFNYDEEPVKNRSEKSLTRAKSFLVKSRKLV
jgi:hypothetical protein